MEQTTSLNRSEFFSFGSGITITAAFDLAAKGPLDSRFVVNTIEERNSHVANNCHYEGMLVYVISEGKTYQYKGGSWKEFNFEIVNDLTTGGTSKVLSAEQGKILNIELGKKANTHTHPYEPANANIQTHISSAHLTLGETSSTAYRGDYGKIAYTHSQSTHAPSNAQKNSDITKAEIEAKLTGAITTHTHAYRPSTWVPSWSDVTSKPSTFAPTIGTTSTTAAAGNHNHDTVYLKKTESHTHSNKDVLDGITTAKIEQWDKGGSGGVLVSATTPTSPTLNMLWVDIS